MECTCRFIGIEWITCQGCLAAIYQEQISQFNKQTNQAKRALNNNVIKPSNKKEGIIINVEFCKK